MLELLKGKERIMSKLSFSKEILVGTAGALSALNFINPIVAPILGVAWESIKLINESETINPLKQNFIEYLSFIAKNKTYFSKNQTDSDVVIGLSILYQEVMKQRFEYKRYRAYGIFVGFLILKNRETFELERIYNTLDLMNIDEILLLEKLYEESYLFYDVNEIFETYKGDKIEKWKLIYEENMEELIHIQSLGIITEINSKRKINKITKFGNQFIIYLN